MNNRKNKLEAFVLLSRCSANKELFGITIEHREGNEWEMMYTYPLNEKRAESEGFGKKNIEAKLFRTTGVYPGCPFCRSISVISCGNCGKLNCYHGSGDAHCAWCGYDSSCIEKGGTMNVDTGMD